MRCDEYDTSLEDINLYVKHANGFNLEDPKLIISIIGGTSQLTLDENIWKAFRNGLTKACLNTKAWLITGGTDIGVAKLTGDSIKNILEKVNVIGIPTWGSIAFRNELKRQKDNKNNDLYVTYFPNRKKYQENEHLISLNPNHSHFLMIDDGSANKFGRAYTFRNNFIDYLKKKHSNLVYLVIEGGLGTMENINEILKKKSAPLILMEGTGGCCDIIINAKNEANKNDM